jgi:putative glutamine amidotransferase
MPARREDFDRRLCKMAVEKRIPILAIGIGMQELNVVCGGTLFQHIPEDFVKPLHHRDPVESTLRHIIEIVPGTRMDTIYGPGEIRVNSQHHMAVDQVADLFKVSATSPDGVIEAYESIDENWFCVGVQWHPENESSSALDMQVFENFIESCRQPEATILQLRRAA